MPPKTVVSPFLKHEAPSELLRGLFYVGSQEVIPNLLYERG
jgi:hypothetical protein